MPTIFPKDPNPCTKETPSTTGPKVGNPRLVSLLKKRPAPPPTVPDHDYINAKRPHINSDQQQLTQEEECRLREQVHTLQNSFGQPPQEPSGVQDYEPPSCCTVIGCYNKGGHPYPMDDERRNAWDIAVRNVPNRNRKLWRPPLTAIVCPVHFKPSDYVTETDSK